MHFEPTNLDGAWLIGLKLASDHRGFFARTFCVSEFAGHGLETTFVQHSTSYSLVRGTIRGMHFQRAPAAEVKVIHCGRGRIYDVIIDLRPRSPTYRRWQGFELSAENRRRLYIPAGYAHGFQTLTDNAEVEYLISAFYDPQSASGVRYDDPAFAIAWPLTVTSISDRDRSWPDFESASAVSPSKA
jgi:dTDP-4-dehydrorhamnose 3,5-epimerase